MCGQISNSDLCISLLHHKVGKASGGLGLGLGLGSHSGRTAADKLDVTAKVLQLHW